MTKWPGGSEGANDLISFLEYYREAGAQVDIINMNENHNIIEIMIFFLKYWVSSEFGFSPVFSNPLLGSIHLRSSSSTRSGLGARLLHCFGFCTGAVINLHKLLESTRPPKVMEWDFPSELLASPSLVYHGQNLLLHDCMYRWMPKNSNCSWKKTCNDIPYLVIFFFKTPSCSKSFPFFRSRGHYEFVVYTDLDERVIPSRPNMRSAYLDNFPHFYLCPCCSDQ